MRTELSPEVRLAELGLVLADLSPPRGHYSGPRGSASVSSWPVMDRPDSMGAVRVGRAGETHDLATACDLTRGSGRALHAMRP